MTSPRKGRWFPPANKTLSARTAPAPPNSQLSIRDDQDSRVLLALLSMPKPVLYMDLMTKTGLTRSQVFRALSRLRSDGLVEWQDTKRGTLRALVRQVPTMKARSEHE